MVGRRLLAIPALALSLGTQTEAQSPSDSLAVLRALAMTLRSHARTVVPQFACYDRMTLCPAETVEAAHPMVRAFAEAVGAELVDARTSGPSCPWGRDQLPAPRGYQLRIAKIQIAGDTARVVIFRRCVNPSRGVHGGFAQDDEYELVRDREGVWHVRGSRMLRITSRPSRLDRATPGAELAIAT